jgi:hypothetical protein
MGYTYGHDAVERCGCRARHNQQFKGTLHEFRGLMRHAGLPQVIRVDHGDPAARSLRTHPVWVPHLLASVSVDHENVCAMNPHRLLSWFVFTLLPAINTVGRASDGIWIQYYSPDLRVYADNLRNAGAPTAVVELLVSQAVNGHFASRELELVPSLASAQSLRAEFSPQRREALLALRLEKDQQLRAALGYVPEETAKKNSPKGVLMRLTPAERDAVRHITGDYNQMIVKVIAGAHGWLMADDREKIRFLESERSVDLGRYLTPEEILDFELLETGYGKSMRSRLQLMAPTQEELRTYLVISKKHNHHLVTEDANSARALGARAGLNKELKTILSAERYADYRRGTSPHYKAILRLTHRLQRSTEVANDVFASQKATTEHGWQLFRKIEPKRHDFGNAVGGTFVIYMESSTLGSPEVKALQQQIARLMDDHLALVQQKLGDEGLKEYTTMYQGLIANMRRGGGSLLDYSIE